MSLLFPAYFLGLLALALPWLLHRFSDQNPPEKLFPSKRFLDATTPPVSRKRTLRYKALLALRVSALFLLCLLFAQPWLTRSGIGGDPDSHHIIAIDRSLSMRSGERWENAVNSAEQLISEFGAVNSVELVSFDNKVRLLASNTVQSDSLTVALNDLEPGYSAADYGTLMQRVNKLAAEQQLPVKLWIISDFQKSALPAQLNALYAPDISELELLEISDKKDFNVHLAATANSTDGVNVSVSATLHYTADHDPTGDAIERTVAVEFNEQLLTSERVLLVPDQLEVIHFDSFVLPAQTNPLLTVRLLETDALVEDDVQSLRVTEGKPAAIVLLVSPDSSDDNASVFVRTALETEGVAEVETVRGTADQVPADSAHVFVGRDINDSVDLDIRQFVDSGNNALVFNTARVQSDVETLIAGDGIVEVDEAHPLALGDIDWFGVNFYRLPELRIAEDDRVLLRTVDQQPVLIERPTNRGRLLILNDSLDGLSSDLPLHPAFVELVRSMISYFDASTSIPEEVIVGKRVALPANTQVLDPQDNPLVALGDSASANSLEFVEPGLYTVVGNRGEQDLRVLLDRREADLGALPDAAMEAWAARYTDVDASEEEQRTGNTVAGAAKSITSIDEHLRESLWRWIFPLLMLALLLESVYANRRLDIRRDGS